jgi:photosystem II stability/assembly factor-like uncharacterized protein
MKSYYVLLAILALLSSPPAIAQSIQWEKAPGSPLLDIDMAIDSMGNIYAKGHFSASDKAQIFRSSDNGSTWTTVTPYWGSGEYRTVRAVAANAFGDIFFAADDGLFRTTDAGATWRQLTDVKPPVATVAVHPDGTILASGSAPALLYRSTDRGESWQWDTLRVPAVWERGLVDPVEIFAFLKNGTTFALSRDGLFRSTDRGVTWDSVARGVATTPFTVTSSGELLAAFKTRVYRSTDKGLNWGAYGNSVDGSSIVSLLATPRGEMLAGVQGVEGGEGIVQSSDGGLTWQQTVGNMLPIVVRHLLASPTGTIFAVSDTFGILRTTAPVVAGVQHNTSAEPEGSVRASVIPNPAAQTSALHITMRHPGHLRIELVDSRGERVAVLRDAVMAEGEHVIPVDLRDLPEGIYFCRLSMNGTSFSTPSPKVVKR